ncbi:MAG TPA: hypothetical protein VNG12_02730 [Acidimicrobiales bacterium]|nr:hypothetical protein [Acidimicrobiales bacterium]
MTSVVVATGADASVVTDDDVEVVNEDADGECPLRWPLEQQIANAAATINTGARFRRLLPDKLIPTSPSTLNEVRTFRKIQYGVVAEESEKPSIPAIT